MMKYNRQLLNSLNSPAALGRARLVLGARQTGKSTVFSMLKNRGNLLIDLQDRAERLRFANDPALLTRTAAALKEAKPHILIDEIQRVPDLLDEVQFILDKNPGKFTFTFTGSSARKLKRGAANLLPGRARLYHIFPVTLPEQERRSREPQKILPMPAAAKPLFPARDLEDILLLGCLPGIWGGMGKEDLLSYAALYIEEEIQREALVRKIGPFGRFLKIAAVESGKNVNLTKVSQETGVALSTLKDFYQALEDTFVGFSVNSYSSSARTRLIKAPKFYFFDTGVRNALAGLPLESGMLATEGGHLFEHWVACELYWRASYLGRGYALYYWRTVSGAEVDFVLETPDEIIPIEVKYTASVSIRDASGIEKFINLYPKAKRGFVIAGIKREEKLTAHVSAIPWHEI